MGWWLAKSRQAVRHVSGRISASERARLSAMLSPAQRDLFETMHPADQRHGLDVLMCLRAGGHDDDELLMAALFHDCAKGRSMRLDHRVAWSLGERYGEGVHHAFARLPGYGVAFERLRTHADASADLALAAGCTERTAELIRHQAAPVDPWAGRALLIADEAC